MPLLINRIRTAAGSARHAGQSCEGPHPRLQEIVCPKPQTRVEICDGLPGEGPETPMIPNSCIKWIKYFWNKSCSFIIFKN
ncbi:MAG: hypothetical protein D6814_05730 [Calditrichaeota bacterium]|nr:MAG: hypothetical protein D6814_05730 [Calditrichota bacterium]